MKRWVQYTMPVFVCFESSDTVEHEEITKVIVADGELEDVHLARDAFGEFVLYDGDFERVLGDREQAHVIATTEARRYWPKRSAWVRGPDPRREPECYEDEDSDEEGSRVVTSGAALEVPRWAHRVVGAVLGPRWARGADARPVPDRFGGVHSRWMGTGPLPPRPGLVCAHAQRLHH